MLQLTLFIVHFCALVLVFADTDSTFCGLCQDAILPSSALLPQDVLPCAHHNEFHKFCWSNTIQKCPNCRTIANYAFDPFKSFSRVCSTGSIDAFTKECKRNALTKEEYVKLDAYGTCLSAAAKNLHFEFVEYLIYIGANLGQSSKMPSILAQHLLTSLKRGNRQAMLWLLKHGASPFVSNAALGQISAMRFAVQFSRPEVAMELLSFYNGTIFIADSSSNRLKTLCGLANMLLSKDLNEATKIEFFRVLEQLIATMKKYNDNLNALRPCGDGVLHYVLKETFRVNQYRVMQILLANGLDPNIQNAEGNTAMHLSQLQYNMPQRLLELFMENGGKLEAQNADGSTLLHLAARNNKVQLIPFLLVNGCDIEAQDKDGKTPLLVAIRTIYVNMIETLLSSGANPLAKDFNENTILHEAVDAKRVLSVRIALKANVPINSANAQGNTALHLAVKQVDYPTIAKLLLSAGADMDLHIAGHKSAYQVTSQKMRIKLRLFPMRPWNMIKHLALKKLD